jgi:antitoxin MazE
MQAVIRKWGNSLGFRIPSAWAKDNGIKNGSKVQVIAEKGKIIIIPQKKSLEDMMKLVTDENLHSEVKTGFAVGNEEW